MDTKTLDALKASIRKWEKNANVMNKDDANVHGSSCPLCSLFSNHVSCSGCPVKEKTGRPQCWDSPWELARDIYCDKNATAENFRAAARVELAFLRSLLPTSGE